MRVRVIEIERSSSQTHTRLLEKSDQLEVVAEGTLVFYRVPAVDGKARWDAAGDKSFAEIVDGCHRVAVLYGEGVKQRLWATSHVVYHKVDGSGFKVRTQNATYRVEILDEGGSVRRMRRQTGAFPVYVGEDASSGKVRK